MTQRHVSSMLCWSTMWSEFTAWRYACDEPVAGPGPEIYVSDTDDGVGMRVVA